MALTYKYNAMPSGRGNFEIYLGYELTQNQSGNYTDIYLEMGLHALTVWAQETWNAQGATSCLINGSGATGQGYDMTGVGTGQHKMLLSTTKRIYHADNGTAAQATLYGSCNCSGTGQGHGTITAYVTPPTIPRASTIKTAGNVVPGKDYPVTITPAASSFSHVLKLLSGNTVIGTKDLAAGVTNATFTADETTALYALYPNSNTANLTLQLTNSIDLTSTKTVQMAIDPAAAAPIFTSGWTYQDSNTTSANVTGDDQLLVSGISNLKVTIPAAYKATSSTNANIAKYVVSCGGQSAEVSYSDTANVSASIAAVTSGTIQVAAVDSRGNQTITAKLATLIPYTRPVIKSLTAARQAGVGEAVLITAEVEIYSQPIGSTTNSVTAVTYKYRATTEAAYTDGTTVITPDTDISQYVKGDTADGFISQNSYVLQITVKDALSSASRETPINSGVPVMDLYRDNTDIRVSIGARADPDGTLLQIAGDNVEDWVIEQGVESGWTYQKYASGKVTCQGRFHVNGAESDSTSPGPTTTIDFPFAIYDVYDAQVTMACHTAWKVLQIYFNYNLLTNTSISTVVYTSKGVSDSTTLYANLAVYGKWKH